MLHRNISPHGNEITPMVVENIIEHGCTNDWCMLRDRVDQDKEAFDLVFENVNTYLENYKQGLQYEDSDIPLPQSYYMWQQFLKILKDERWSDD